MRLLIAPLLIVLSTASATAAPGMLCQAVKADAGEAAAAAIAVFSGKARSKADDCIYPLERLRYGDADVLLTKRGGPDQNDCHGCGARLSAFVLRRTPEGPRLVASFPDFAEIGSSGQASGFAAIQLDGHDAFGVLGGGTFQGYTSETISFFVFREGRLDKIEPFLPLSADDSGALDEGRATSVNGAWHVAPGRPGSVTIDYSVKAGGRTRRASATWRLDGNTLRLVGGRVPEDYKTASGQ